MIRGNSIHTMRSPSGKTECHLSKTSVAWLDRTTLNLLKSFRRKYLSCVWVKELNAALKLWKSKKKLAGQGSLYIRRKKDFQFVMDEHVRRELMIWTLTSTIHVNQHLSAYNSTDYTSWVISAATITLNFSWFLSPFNDEIFNKWSLEDLKRSVISFWLLKERPSS